MFGEGRSVIMSRLQMKTVFRANEFLSLTFSRILLIVMMTCFGTALVQVIQGFVPTWNGSFLGLFCLITSIEAILMQNRLRKASDLEHSTTFYRVMEWVVILIVLKIALYFQEGWGTLLDDLPNWSRDFLGSFFNTDYFLSIFVLAAVWGFTLWFVTDLEEIETDVTLVDASDLGGFYSNRSAVRGRMANRFLTIGFIIVFMTALFTLDFDALFKGSVVFQHRSGALNLIMYFLAGMLLLSQTQFSVLRAGWAWERIPIQPHIARRWILYSLVALVLVTGIAFILPTSYSMGLLATMGYIFSLLFSLLAGLILLLLSPFIMLFAWLLRLLGKGGPNVALPQVTLPTPPPEAVGRVRQPWMDVVQSVLFWSIFIGVIGYSFYQYFKQNKELLQKIKGARGIKFLLQAWDWIRGRLHGFNQAVTAVVGAGVQRLRAFMTRSSPKDAWNYLNLRRLTPRQQVLFFYLALIRRGGESGLPRKPSQTPYEYARYLDKSLPEVSQSVDSMTESFMEARYSNHAVETDQANRVQSYWERIRRAFQELRRGPKAR
jgi:hypothetical protein